MQNPTSFGGPPARSGVSSRRTSPVHPPLPAPFLLRLYLISPHQSVFPASFQSIAGCKMLLSVAASATDLRDSPSPAAVHSPMECQWLAQMRAHRLYRTHPTQSGDFDLLRWLHAYSGDVNMAVRKYQNMGSSHIYFPNFIYRRHLHVRELLQLDGRMEDKVADEEGADVYAPLDILGTVGEQDGRVLLLERTGQFELDAMMQKIRTSAFMLNRFRLMERILGAVRDSERETGRRQSAVLVMDLEGIRLQANLVAFVSGPYRIMWGNLVEQYPSLLSSILAIHSPTFINVLWSACAPFIGDQYRQRVHLLGANWRERIDAEGHLPLRTLPSAYGGERVSAISCPSPCRIVPLSDTDGLERLSIPAGGFLVQTFFLSAQEVLEFRLRNETEFTLNMFYSAAKRTLKAEEILAFLECSGTEEQTHGMEEALAGCERPGLPTVDSWKWCVPKAGFYHLVFGNEKAWILSVSVDFQLFQLHPNGTRVKLRPIPM